MFLQGEEPGFVTVVKFKGTLLLVFDVSFLVLLMEILFDVIELDDDKELVYDDDYSNELSMGSIEIVFDLHDTLQLLSESLLCFSRILISIVLKTFLRDDDLFIWGFRGKYSFRASLTVNKDIKL